MPVARFLTVLIVDDQEVMRRIMRGHIAKLGFVLIEMANSGMEALQKMQQQRFDLVISDFNMDNGSGLELLQGIRAHPVLKRTPVIMVTGNAETSTVQAVVKAGVNGYVVKPVSLEAIKARIVKILGPLE